MYDSRMSSLIVLKLTVNLGARAVAALEYLSDKLGVTKTDTVNHALTLYEFLEKEQDAGKNVLIEDHGRYDRVKIL